MTAGTKTKFRGTTIAVSSGLGSPGTITGITAANPPVVSQSAHGYADRDIVFIEAVVGMTELNDKYFVVDNVTAGTYSLQGISALDYTAYASGGTAKKATMTNFCNLTGYDASTGTTGETLDETICSTELVPEFGLPDPGSVTMAYNLDEGSAVQIALEASRRAASQVAVKISYPAASGSKVMVDIGVVTQTGVSGQAGTPNWTGTATLRRVRNRLDAVLTA